MGSVAENDLRIRSRGYRASQHAVATAAASALRISFAPPQTATLALHSVPSLNESCKQIDNALQQVTKTVVEAARESLVIGRA